MVSLDYSTAQWVLSIIVGVCLTKVYITIAHHIHYRKEIVFYVPYFLAYRAHIFHPDSLMVYISLLLSK